jgi:hypothetical protein
MALLLLRHLIEGHLLRCAGVVVVVVGGGEATTVRAALDGIGLETVPVAAAGSKEAAALVASHAFKSECVVCLSATAAAAAAAAHVTPTGPLPHVGAVIVATDEDHSVTQRVVRPLVETESRVHVVTQRCAGACPADLPLLAERMASTGHPLGVKLGAAIVSDAAASASASPALLIAPSLALAAAAPSLRRRFFNRPTSSFGPESGAALAFGGDGGGAANSSDDASDDGSADAARYLLIGCLKGLTLEWSCFTLPAWATEDDQLADAPAVVGHDIDTVSRSSHARGFSRRLGV